MERPSTSSVRFRVTAVASVAVALVLALSALVLVGIQRRALSDILDESLVRRADTLAPMIEAGTSVELPGTSDEDAAQLTDLDGNVVASSSNLDSEIPMAPSPEGRAALSNQVIATLGEDQFRVLSRRVDRSDGPAILHLASTRDAVTDSIEALIASVAIVTPLTLVPLAWLVWWLVGRALRPVEAIRVETEAVTSAELGRRVPVPAQDDEIGRLARTMNAMLDRIEAGMARQRQFTADASHELRSPLTRIRSELEVDLAHPKGADLVETHRSIRDEVMGMQRLLDDLLHLARADSAGSRLRTEPVDLDDLALEAGQLLRSEGRVEVNLKGVHPARVEGDRPQLARVVANLTDNAARHASTSVSIDTSVVDGWAVLEVADDGPGVPVHARTQIFERFSRLDEGRARGDGGAGLGLSIVADIVERHGGSVEVGDSDGAGARFVVRLPAAPS